jgi:hypothetical protein
MKLCHTLASNAPTKHPQGCAQSPLHRCSTATLLINGIEVVSNLPSAIRRASTTQDLRAYMEKKYKWTTATADNIDWHCHGTALSRLKGSKQRFIHKFIHEWTPVNGHKSQGHQGSAALCPFCKNEVETQQHFLTCQHPRARAQWMPIVESAKAFLDKKEANSKFTNLVTAAISEWVITPDPAKPKDLPPAYDKLFEKQRKIGWDQVLKGRWSEEWIVLYDKTNKNSSATGRATMNQLTSRLWTGVHGIWKQRCQEQHGTDSEQFRVNALSRLTPRVEALYQSQELLDSIDRRVLDKPIETILALPIHNIAQWLYKFTPFIKRGILRAERRIKENVSSITKYMIVPRASITRKKTKAKQRNEIEQPTGTTKQTNLHKFWQPSITTSTMNHPMGDRSRSDPALFYPP